MRKLSKQKTLNVGAGTAIGVLIGLVLNDFIMGIGIGIATGIAMSFETKNGKTDD